VDPKDQLKFRLAVDPFERAGDCVAGDAVLIDVQDLEQVLWNVIEGAQDNNVVFFEVPVYHSDLRVSRRSWSTTPSVTPRGRGKVIGCSQLGRQAKTSRAPARAWGIARSRLSFARSIQDKVSRKPTPAAKSSKKGVDIYTSP
jgi:hypothetical protein